MARVAQFSTPDEADYGALADTLLAVAEERREASARVRGAVLAALDRGDVAGARALVERWTVEAVEEIASGLQERRAR
jgi:hypothetical protein